MIWLYRLLFWPLFLILLPNYMLRLWRRGGKWHLRERFGFIRPPARKAGVERLWLHAVSVGELNSIGPLLRELKNNPAVEVCLSVTTTTARAIAENKLKDFYTYLFTFPIDNFSPKALSRLNPDRIIFVEGELWPELLWQARKKNIPVYIIGARLSDRSFRRFSCFKGMTRQLLAKVSGILAATQQDAERYLRLGANPELLTKLGSLKFDAVNPKPLPEAARTELWTSLGFPKDAVILLGSSTWAGEEKILLDAFLKLKAQNEKLRLLLVPRHAERRSEVEPLLKNCGCTYHMRSRGLVNGAPEVVLADTTGELAALTQLCALVFIGKSLPPHKDGQNPLEAAAVGKPILMGRGMSNFRQIAQELEEAKGGAFVGSAMELEEALAYLLAHEDYRRTMGEAARAYFEKNRGATLRTLEWLELLPEGVKTL